MTRRTLSALLAAIIVSLSVLLPGCSTMPEPDPGYYVNAEIGLPLHTGQQDAKDHRPPPGEVPRATPALEV